MRRITIFISLLALLIFPAGASWWNASWVYQYNDETPSSIGVLSLNISNNTATFGNSTHLNVVCSQANCTDLRVTGNNTTELPFWRELNTSTNGTSYGVWWINVTCNCSVNIYSGAIGVSDASNGNTTFPFFDDFSGASLDTTKWTQSGGTVSISNGIMSFSTNSVAYARLYTANFGDNTILEEMVKTDHAGSNTHSWEEGGFGDCGTGGTSPSCIMVNFAHGDAEVSSKYSISNSGSITSIDMSPAWVASRFGIISVYRHGQADFYQNRTGLQTASTNYPTNPIRAQFGLYSYDGTTAKVYADWFLSVHILNLYGPCGEMETQ